MIPTIEIDEEGNLSTLLDERLSLCDIGYVHDVHRASFIDWNEPDQQFYVRHAKTNEIVYRNKSRQACIDWEIENFGSGGKYYHDEVIR